MTFVPFKIHSFTILHGETLKNDIIHEDIEHKYRLGLQNMYRLGGVYILPVLKEIPYLVRYSVDIQEVGDICKETLTQAHTS